MSELRVHNKMDYMLGFFVALPFAYPAPPFYVFPFLFALFVMPRVVSQRIKIDILSLVILFLYSLSLVVSSVVVSYEMPGVSYTALLGSLVFVVLFVLAHYIRDLPSFFKGFMHGALVACAITIGLFFFLGAYRHGLRVFYIPELRMWGEGLIPDWPNYIVFFYCCAALLLVFFKRKLSLQLVVVLAAAMATTSRLAVFCIMIVALLLCLNFSKRVWLMLALSTVVLLFYGGFQISLDDQLLERMNKSSDREGLFNGLLLLWLDRPLLGYGAISLDSVSDLDYRSFHNSYLEALVKGGIVGFTLFALFIVRGFFVVCKSDTPALEKSMLIIIFAFFLVSSFFQNYLKHPHVIVLYSVIFYRLSSYYRVKVPAGY